MNKPDLKTDLLARLSQWHPGQEVEALAEAERHARAVTSEPITDVIAYISRWPDDQLAKIHIPKPKIAFCGNCDNGWILDVETNLPARRCDCRSAANRSAASLRDGSGEFRAAAS